ncbi:MAG: CHAT domain-containing protein, partial [bacterium]|nr:CHAT domain-containing protein [bacterium]
RGAKPGRTLQAIEPGAISDSFTGSIGVILGEVEGKIIASSFRQNRRDLVRIVDSASVANPRRALSGAHLALLQGREGAVERFETIIEELDRRILGPMRPLLGGNDPIVMSLADDLLSLPWGALPSLRGRALSLVPSLSWWCHVVSDQQQAPTGQAVLVAGPDLDHADREIEMLRTRHYPRAIVLTGPDATAQALIDACQEGDIVHVAAHGRFRDDSPMFSSIELADGPLSIFELGQVADPPRRLILSTCDLGRHGTTPMARASGLV